MWQWNWEKSKKNKLYEKLCQQLAVILSQEETSVNRTILITRCELQKVGEEEGFYQYVGESIIIRNTDIKFQQK